MKTIPALLLLLSLATLLPQASARGGDRLNDIDAFIRRAMKEYGVPGASVAIVRDDETVMLRGYGFRQAGKPDRVDDHTLFSIRSATKTFTGAAVGTLVDAGVLDWDDPVVDHMPEFALYDAYATRMVTARDLLAHRSGLPAHTGNLFDALGHERKEVLRRIRFMKPNHSFREKAGYSNLGYFAAGMLASRAGRQSWEQLVEERLFGPLGMDSSGVSTNDWKTTPNHAAAHLPRPDGGFDVHPWDNHDTLGPAGSITSTAFDMSRWVRMHLNGGVLNGRRILSAEVVREMQKPAMVATPTFAELPPIDEHSGYAHGLGWDSYHFAGHEIIEKGGAGAGMRSCVTLVPEKKLGIVVLANRNLTVLPEAVRAYVLAAYVGTDGRDLQAEIRQKSREIDHLFSTPSPSVKAGADPSLPLDHYVGVYVSDLYGRLRIKHASGRLSWHAGPAEFGAAVQHVSFDNFLLQFPAGGLTLPVPAFFRIDPTGRPTALVTESFGTFTRHVP